MQSFSKRLVATTIAAALMAGACSGAATTSPGASGTGAAPAVTPATGGIPVLAKDKEATVGPNGETGTPYTNVTVSATDLAAIQALHLKAALVWYDTEPFFDALDRGIASEFQKLGVQIVAQTNYNNDPSQLVSQMETVMALKPDILLTLATDPVVGAQAYQPAVTAGVKIVMLSTLPQGYTAGNQYVTLVTGDHYLMGKGAADLLAQALGDKGNIAMFYINENFYVANRRDQVAKTTFVNDYPNMKIVAEEGYTDATQIEPACAALIVAHPEINGIYLPDQTWAEGCVAALRTANRPDVRVTSIDLGPEMLLDMAQCGNIYGLTAEHTADMGATMAMAGALAKIGKTLPPFITAGGVQVTRSNMADVYQSTYLASLPQSVTTALQTQCSYAPVK